MKAKHSLTEIDRLQGRHRSNISREIESGHGQRGYRAEQACNKSQERAQGSRNTRRVQTWVWAEVPFYLGVEWSPEQIGNKLPISHGTLYQHVYDDKASGGKLHKGLRSQKPRRKRHLCGCDRRGQIPNRCAISERPLHIEGRKQVGHWEGDTVIGAGHSQAIEDVLKPLTGQDFAVENGKEFAYHQKVDQALGIQTYFTDLYCSWQRGSNENFNGLLRQSLLKKRRMETVTDEGLTIIENRLNHRPRKRLGFKTPYEGFHASLNYVALRA